LIRRRPSCRRAIVLVVLATLACAGAPSALAAPESVLPPGLTLSIQDDHLAVTPESNVEARLDLVAATGVRVTRVDVLWNEVAPARPARADDPSDPAYRWSRYDRVVDGLGRRGIAAILNVYRSPPWANGGRGHAWAPSETDYGAFMTALARRYDGVTPDRTGLVHGPVELFQAWNEPNIPRFLQPQWQRNAGGGYVAVSPRIYAGLLSTASRSVKAVQPGAWIIGFGGAPNGTDRPPSGGTGVITFVRGLVPHHPPADAFAQHLYPAAAPSVTTAMPSFRRLDELIGELDRVRPGLPIMITEFGWTTSPTSVRASFVSEGDQAAHLREAVEVLAANPRVRLAVWFNLQDNAEWTSGLRRGDLGAKPSWDVFAELPKFRPAQPPPPPSPAAAPVAAATSAPGPTLRRAVPRTSAAPRTARRPCRAAGTRPGRTAAGRAGARSRRADRARPACRCRRHGARAARAAGCGSSRIVPPAPQRGRRALSRPASP
jgi:Cellulase (glycosyl hydrolase family 5)